MSSERLPGSMGLLCRSLRNVEGAPQRIDDPILHVIRLQFGDRRDEEGEGLGPAALDAFRPVLSSLARVGQGIEVDSRHQ